MRRRTVFLTGAAAAIVAGGVVGGMAVSQAAVAPRSAVAAGAPYIYPAVGGSKDPVSVMQKTGVRAYTLAFILAKGGCDPAWDGSTAITDSAHKNRINAIRAAGGDVVISFGGYAGTKLGDVCSNETQLAGAYQKVIDAYRLKEIDIDLEDGGAANQNEVGQSQKVLKALRIVRQKNPGITTVMTLGTGTGGLVGNQAPIPKQAAGLGDPVDIWTIMPFDFGGGGGGRDMGKLSLQASEGLHKQLKAAFPGKSDAKVYSQQGISSMNGSTDNGENVTVANFKTMLAYCQQHHLARFTYWELNRDNANLDYTRVIGQFKG